MSIFFLFVKVADSKREEFRKYLEKAGVMDALTKGEFLVDFEFILFLLLSFFPVLVRQFLWICTKNPRNQRMR